MILRVFSVLSVSIFAAIASYEWVYLPYLADAAVPRLTRRTERAVSGEMTQYETTLLARETLREATTLSAKCPTNMHLYMLAAANERIVGNAAGAVETYRRALSVEERPEIYAAMSEALFAMNKLDESADALAAAIEFGSGFISRAPTPEFAAVVSERVEQRRRSSAR